MQKIILMLVTDNYFLTKVVVIRLYTTTCVMPASGTERGIIFAFKLQAIHRI
jgi:hypothetical protein